MIKVSDIIASIEKNNLIGDCIFRGVKNIDGDFTLNKVRTDRNPTNTLPELHDKLNELFYKKFHKNLRSATVFGTKNDNFATDFGTLCIIVPKDKPTYYYNENIKDLFFKLNNMINFHGINYTVSELNGIIDGYIKTTNIESVNRTSEIMIDCKEYYLINTTEMTEMCRTYEDLKYILKSISEDTMSGDIANVEIPLGDDIKNKIITRIKKIKKNIKLLKRKIDIKN